MNSPHGGATFRRNWWERWTLLTFALHSVRVSTPRCQHQEAHGVSNSPPPRQEGQRLQPASPRVCHRRGVGQVFTATAFPAPAHPTRPLVPWDCLAPSMPTTHHHSWFSAPCLALHI